ncbi:hypothetical protein GCM10023187_05390 [Nibrella viscosa]|uniref:Chromosome partition protein Smc n=1 Tax=Nibrella viscosa TaxID=1084524 RepID=A0ABP8JWI2_9BACT
MSYSQAKTATIWLSILSLFLLGSSLYYWNRSGNLNRLNHKTELKADSLLSVKLDLERNIRQISDELNGQLSEVKTLNLKLEYRVESTQNKLQAKNNLLNKLRQRNATTVSQLNKQVADLTGMRNNLQGELTQVKSRYQQSLTDNTSLKDNSATLAEQNKTLSRELTELKTLITADNFRVDVRKPNHKLTAKARKADEVHVTCMLPSVLQQNGGQTLYMSITDMKNNPMDGLARTKTIKTKETSFQIPVHATQQVDMAETPQKVSLNYEPLHRVASGTYKVSLYTDTAYLGSTEFSLR